MTPLTQRLRLSTAPAPMSQAPLTLEFYRGIPLIVEVAVFDTTAIASLTGVSSLTMMVRASREGTTEAALISQTVASFTSCTAPQWIAGTHEHAVFEFTAAECNLDLSGGTKAPFWLVFKALLNTGEELILGTGRATCYEVNAGDAGDPPTNPNPGISTGAADLRYLMLAAQTLTTEQQLQLLANIGLGWLAGATLSGGKVTLSTGQSIFVEAAS